MIVMDAPVNYIRNGRPKRASHLLSSLVGAEGREELLAFGKGIGLRAQWLQKRGTAHEHFDLLGSYIEKARQAGAIKVDRRRLVEILREKKVQLGLILLPRKVINARAIAKAKGSLPIGNKLPAAWPRARKSQPQLPLLENT